MYVSQKYSTPLAIMAFRSIQPVLIDRGVPRIPNRYRKLVMSSNDVHSLLHLPGIIAIHIFMVQLPPIGRLLMSVSILACLRLAGSIVLRY